VLPIKAIILCEPPASFGALYVELPCASAALAPHRIPLERIRLYTHQVLLGLQHMHSARILHRDIKPDNLLLFESAPGEPPRAALCDFNLARNFDGGEAGGGDGGGIGSGSRGRQTPTVVTPAWRAPEVFAAMNDRGAPDYGPKVDVFSVGCILAEMLQYGGALARGMEAAEARRPVRLFDGGRERQRELLEGDFAKHLRELPLVQESRALLGAAATADFDAGLDLVNEMLRFDSGARYGVAQCLSHPFLVGVSSTAAADLAHAIASGEAVARALFTPFPQCDHRWGGNQRARILEVISTPPRARVYDGGGGGGGGGAAAHPL
jgi:serine/threonine protein kinase